MPCVAPAQIRPGVGSVSTKERGEVDHAVSTVSSLSFAINPRLDAALSRGSDSWLATSRAVGVVPTTRWMTQRADLSEQIAEVEEVVAALLATGAQDLDGIAELMAELAELVTGDDDALAEALAEGVLAHGIAIGDAEVIADAVGHLAELAEAVEDFLTAAEFHVDFLNWRRRPDASSDPESVSAAFDEIIRLAELDGATQAAAIYGFRQVAFERLVDADDETAASGEWDPKAGPYEGWS